MKTTVDHEAATELVMFVENDSRTYFSSLSPIMDGMDKKRQRGIFDAEKAVKGFEYCAEYAARRYVAEFGGLWYQVFNAATRRAAAVLLLDRYLSDVL